MTQPESFTIIPTMDPAVFDRLAAKMVATDPWITLGMDLTGCRSAFEGSFKKVFVAFSGEEPAGMAILQTSGTFNGYIQTLFVAEPFQCKGLGKKLLAYCEESIHRTSPNVFICVSSFNSRARRLYESQGFTLVGTLTDFLVKGHDEWLLRKSIGPRLGYRHYQPIKKG
jgi:ribosomal protein S18 acetylase RimI-like enzyme